MQFEKWYDIDLKKPRQFVPDIGFPTFEGDNNSVRIGVNVFSDKAPSDVAGTIKGYCILPNGVALMPWDGAKEGNRAWIDVPDDALIMNGRITLSIRCFDADETTVLFQASATVRRVDSERHYDPEDEIGDVTDLIEEAERVSGVAAQAAQDAQDALAQASDIVSYATQTGQTDAQKATARTNIEAASEQDVSDLRGASDRFDACLYSYTPVNTNAAVKNNYQLNDSGLYGVSTSYKTIPHPVVAGQYLKIVSSYKFQFQSENTVPTSGDSSRVGSTYGAGTFFVTVPEGASWLHISILKTDTTAAAYHVTRRVDAIENRLLDDEEIVLLLEKEADNIREINLNASFFQAGYSSRRTSLKVFNPTTLKGLFPTAPSSTVYDNLDIGRRTLYLKRGDRIITNIDAVYDNAKLQLPNQTFANSGYFGVILSTFQNSNDTDNGSVYFGREAFDGKWRILEIGVSGYYELSFRADVSYTNKAYIWHQHKCLVGHNDIISDITGTLSFKDGTITYNAVTGWGDNTIADIGSSGGYQRKSVLITGLSSYVGKSVLISGLDMKTTETQPATNTGNPAIIYYDDATPTTYRLSYTSFVYENDYAAFPIVEGYDMRVQFFSTACLPFVRVWIVDNATLISNGLVNPVFYGKKILGFGDSYIAGQGVTWTWHAVLAARNACDYVRKGYGGEGLCYGSNGTLLDHLSDLDEDADIYILTFGRNDSSTNIKIGEDDDVISDDPEDWTPSYLINTATFKGAMNFLFNYIETLHPTAQVVCVTPWAFENNTSVTSGLTCLDYIDAMQRISEKWGIHCFNAAQDCGIHVRIESFRTAYFLAYNDQSHLNNNGHALMYKRAFKLLTNQMYDE